MKKVIYTSLVGDYDDFTDPHFVNDKWDYICFSNHLDEKKFNIWKIKRIPLNTKNKTVLSRYVKINPHVVLSDYDYSIYIDSNIDITSNFLYDRADELIKSNEIISLSMHPLRDCIYDEAKVCIQEGRDKKKNIMKTVNYLKKKDYPAHQGLFENGVIFRNHNHPKITSLSEQWWDLYLKLSKRDQLTFAFLLWSNKIPYTYLLPKNKSFRSHPGFSFKPHKKNILKSLKLRMKILLNKF